MTYTKKELKKYLKGLLKEKAGLATFTFVYQSGQTAFHSRLRIILTSEKIEHWKIPKGTPADIAEEKKAAKIREIEFTSENLSIFIQVLLKKKIWDLENCSERAIPDTATLTFTIRDNEELLFEQNVYEMCRNDDSRTIDLLRALTAIIPRDWTPP